MKYFSAQNIDSARANLASTFVNAFVNAGFGNDKLMVGAAEGESWVYKNKEHGLQSPLHRSPADVDYCKRRHAQRQCFTRALFIVGSRNRSVARGQIYVQ